jgi:outer membrane receptor protein involved in Fe transport
MKYLFLLLFVSFICCPQVFAQADPNAAIKGKIMDAAKAEPIGFVTVSLREMGKTDALKSTYTKDNGEFTFSGLVIKPYEVVVSYVGFQTEIIKVENLSATNLKVELPVIKLQANTKQLKEVEVTTQKILVTQDIDKISYDVEADPESKDETVLNMMRKVPLLTVDADDNVQLKGSSSYKILVNGKSSGLFANNPKDVLKSMPASSIKKIEVITNPPAKYEAEGVGGIINIITNKKMPGGYNGSVNAGLRSPFAYNAGAYLTVKTGKFGFSGNYGSNSWASPVNRNNFIRTDKTDGTQLTQNGEGKNSGLNQYGSAQASFEFDSLNLLTANYSAYNGHDDNKMDLQVALEDANENFLQKYRRQNKSSEGWNGFDIGLDYQRGFVKSADQLLTLSYKYNLGGNKALTDFNYIPEINYEAQTGKTQNRSQEGEHTVQADYVQPFGKNTLEVGAKSITRLNSSTYFYSVLNPENGEFEINPAQSNDFSYHQDIYAGYLSLNLKKNNWGLKLGSRLEETKVNATFTTSETAAKQDYFNLIPSAALSRKLTETQDLKFSYTQRLQRPGLWLLNPYTDSTDKKNISYGNPGLDATTSHSFELGHSTFIKNSSFNSSIFYTFTNNAIQQYTTQIEGTDVLATTFENLGKEQNLGLSLNSSLNLTKKLNLSLNTNVNYIALSSMVNGQEVQNNGVTGNIYGYGSYKFEKNWRFNSNAGYFSRNVLLQGRSGGYFYSSFSLGKTFLKDDKATFSLTASNPFQKYRTWKNTLDDAAFSQQQQSIHQIRRFGFSLSYKFGKLEGGIAQKKRGIENDDVKSGKSGGGN